MRVLRQCGTNSERLFESIAMATPECSSSEATGRVNPRIHVAGQDGHRFIKARLLRGDGAHGCVCFSGGSFFLIFTHLRTLAIHMRLRTCAWLRRGRVGPSSTSWVTAPRAAIAQESEHQANGARTPGACRQRAVQPRDPCLAYAEQGFSGRGSSNWGAGPEPLAEPAQRLRLIQALPTSANAADSASAKAASANATNAYASSAHAASAEAASAYAANACATSAYAASAYVFTDYASAYATSAYATAAYAASAHAHASAYATCAYATCAYAANARATSAHANKAHATSAHATNAYATSAYAASANAAEAASADATSAQAASIHATNAYASFAQAASAFAANAYAANACATNAHAASAYALAAYACGHAEYLGADNPRRLRGGSRVPRAARPRALRHRPSTRKQRQGAAAAAAVPVTPPGLSRPPRGFRAGYPRPRHTTGRRGKYERARYGQRASRIGEASHPGPPNRSSENLQCNRRARLRHVIWQAQQQGAAPWPSGGQHELDRARVLQPHRSARAAASAVASLARECGDVPVGTIPRNVHEQQWSAVNVPVIWHAAGTEDRSPVVEWFALASQGAPQVDIGVRSALEPFVAVTEGWRALRRCLRNWGITSRDNLGPGLRRLGFRVPQTLTNGQYLSKRLQEAILEKAANENINVALLEASYVVVTLHLAQQPGLVAELEANMRMRSRQDDHAQLPPPHICTSPAEGHNPATADEEASGIAHNQQRPHDPAHADTEMAEAGVGAHPAIFEDSVPDATSRPSQHLDPRPRLERRRGPAEPGAMAALAASLARPNPAHPKNASRARHADDRLPAEPPPHAWEALDGIDLWAEFRKRRNVLRSCPRIIRGRYRHAQRLAMEAIDTASRANDALAEERGWKLFGMLSILLLHRSACRGAVAKAELEQRCALFARGDWEALLASANITPTAVPAHARTAEEERAFRRELACNKVRIEELSKARQALTARALAPGNDETLQALRSRPQELSEDLPEEAETYQPASPIVISFAQFVKQLKSAPRGASGGPGETTNEHLKVALDDEDTAALLHRCAQRLAHALVPASVAKAYMSARMTALRKPNGKVRGIATGTAFRRLVASCIARVIGPSVEEACKPYQYALSTRAGTECVGHLFRAACDLDPDLCILSIDGIGAFDHVKRAAMLRKLASVPKARDALPFVRLSYASPTEYTWTDDKGHQHDIRQGEGGEQGDPLMPLLFALGIHDALREVADRLDPGEDLAAFLDDVYVLCKPARVRTIYDMLSNSLERHAGIELHSGKTKVWNRRGHIPPDISDLGGEEGAWNPHGVILLGVPVGTPDFVQSHAEERLAEERRLLEEIAKLPDPQCAWQLLSKCAVPKGNYWIRTLPPSLSQSYATQRDEALWHTCLDIFAAEGVSDHERRTGQRIAQLPARMGGLGVRSTARTAPAAYWASWADALEMIKARNPDLTERILQRLEGGTSPADGCLHELSSCVELLRADGFDAMPGWQELAAGARPPPLPQPQDPTDRLPGWQYFASSAREKIERTRVLLSMCRSARALLRSQSGPGAAAALEAAPTCRSCTLHPENFQAWIRRRLRWPLPLAEFKCRCGQHVDKLGDHHSSCNRSGRVKARATPLERMVAQICREAGARVQTNVKLRDLNISTRASDERQIEVIASGLPVFGGVQLAVDVTLRSALHGSGQSRPEAHWRDGAIAEAARRDKEKAYPELADGSRCRLVVLAIETGGRFSQETVEFLRQLAEAKALTAPSFQRTSAAVAFQRRWTRMLAVCAASSFAQSLLLGQDCLGSLDHAVSRQPWLQAVLTESRHETASAHGGAEDGSQAVHQ